MQNIIRIYTDSDNAMQTRAHTIYGILGDDLALFTAIYPHIDAPWRAALLAAYNTAVAYPLDESSLIDIRVLTQDVNASVKQGMVALRRLDSHVEQVYAEGDINRKSFGQNLWEDARNNQLLMAKALLLAHAKANQNPWKAALLGDGYTQGEIDNLAIIAQNIQDKDLLQEEAKTNRPVTTQGRIMVNNTLYRMIVRLRICAEEVFIDNPAKLAQYRTTAPEAPTTTTVTVHIEDALGNPQADVNVTLLNAPMFGVHVTDANGNAVFQGNSMPDVLDIHCEKPPIPPVDSMDNAIIAGEENTIDIVMG
ncbi:MAG: hypothetical protein NTX03_15230 [Bacteroidetes bacterium]|nr:hypothetical protein [Bacteroidota bacterium]